MWFQGYSRITYPLTILPTFEGNLRNKKKSLGRANKQIIAYFYQGKMDAYLSKEDEDYYHQTVLKKIAQDPNFMKKVEREIKKAIKDLLRFSTKLYQSPLEKYSDERLFFLLSKFHKLYAEIFAFGLVNTYDRDLVEEVKKYFLTNWTEEKALRFFTVFTSVTQSTYYEKEKKDLLKAAIKFKKIKDTKEKDGILNQLVKNYGWLFINYEGRPRTKKDFEKIIQEILKEEKDIQKALKDLVKKKMFLKLEQHKLKKKLKIDPFHLHLLKAIRQNAYLREWRKSLAIKAIFQERKLLEEIAKRLNLTEKELKFLLPAEIEKALKTKEIDRQIIKRRMIESIYDLQRTSYKVLLGKKAKTLLERLIILGRKEEVKEVRGVTAYPGKVVGKVRLVLDLKDLKKFKKDEIFVGKATSPELISVFRKAKAVITDEGGLTSHAAIVSREMRVPCVVGTKVASKYFKTGDKIEINATKGILHKLK